MIEDGWINSTHVCQVNDKSNDWRVLDNNCNEIVMWLRRATTAYPANDLAARNVDWNYTTGLGLLATIQRDNTFQCFCFYKIRGVKMFLKWNY